MNRMDGPVRYVRVDPCGVRRREWQRVREWEREIAILPTLDNYPHSRHTLS